MTEDDKDKVSISKHLDKNTICQSLNLILPLHCQVSPNYIESARQDIKTMSVTISFTSGMKVVLKPTEQQ